MFSCTICQTLYLWYIIFHFWYVNLISFYSREKYKSEYEIRLKNELDEFTSKTNSELEKIKNNTKEMYERENR